MFDLKIRRRNDKRLDLRFCELHRNRDCGGYEIRTLKDLKLTQLTYSQDAKIGEYQSTRLRPCLGLVVFYVSLIGLGVG